MRNSDLLTVMESWTRIVAEVVRKARSQIQFGAECQPDVIARQSLLEASSAVRKLEDFNIDKAVSVFKRTWNKKVC